MDYEDYESSNNQKNDYQKIDHQLIYFQDQKSGKNIPFDLYLDDDVPFMNN